MCGPGSAWALSVPLKLTIGYFSLLPPAFLPPVSCASGLLALTDLLLQPLMLTCNPCVYQSFSGRVNTDCVGLAHLIQTKHMQT